MRQFTVEQANRTLPLVRRIVEDVVAQHRRWRETILELDLVASASRSDDAQTRGEELEQRIFEILHHLGAWLEHPKGERVRAEFSDWAVVVSKKRFP